MKLDFRILHVMADLYCLPKILIFVMSLMFIMALQLDAQDDGSAETDFVLERQNVIMHSLTTNNQWSLDVDSLQIQRYNFEQTGHRFQGYFIDSNAQILFGVEVTDSVNWFQGQFGVFDLIQIDLHSGERTILYTGENISIDGHFPNSSRYILLSSPSSNEPLTRLDTPDFCLLDVDTTECRPINHNAAVSMYQFSPVHWLNYETFTDGNLITNAFTNEQQRINEDWITFAFTQLNSPNELLTIVYPNDGTFSTAGPSTLAELNLNTFELLPTPCNVPPYTDITAFTISSDDRYVLYRLENYAEYQTTIVDLQTCESAFEANELDQISGLVWLPGTHDLIASIVQGDANSSNVVRINAETGAITSLFEIDDRVYFTVVQ